MLTVHIKLVHQLTSRTVPRCTTASHTEDTSSSTTVHNISPVRASSATVDTVKIVMAGGTLMTGALTAGTTMADRYISIAER